MRDVPKIYLFSATIPKVTSDIMREIFQIRPNDILKFESKYFLTQGQSHIQLKKVHSETRNKCLQKVVSDILEECIRRPVIVFGEPKEVYNGVFAKLKTSNKI